MNAWHATADALGRWAWERLVNRHDVWGRYGDAGTYTAPAVGLRGQRYLDVHTVVRHFRATRRADVLGLHTTSPDNTCRWAAADIDRHGDGNDPRATLAAALAWFARARGLGFRPLLTGSNGAGGYHLHILFRAPVPAPLAYTFVRWLCRDHERHGLPSVECFPKQARVGKCGSWLRLPGRHHTREYWSEVWDGSRWLAGREAVAYLLTFEGDNPGLVPREAQPVRPAARRVRPVRAPAGSLEERIEAYIARVPHRGEGQHRDDYGYRLACWLVRDLALGDDAARPWLERWDGGNYPPKGSAEIEKWLVSARRYGKHAYGCGLEGVTA